MKPSFYIGASGKDIMHVSDLLGFLVKLNVIRPDQHGWFFRNAPKVVVQT